MAGGRAVRAAGRERLEVGNHTAAPQEGGLPSVISELLSALTRHNQFLIWAPS